MNPLTKCKVINEKNCVRRIRFSTTLETTAQNDDSILVYARLRPFSSPSDIFQYNDTNVKYCEKDKRGAEKLLDFSFHKVFAPSVKQHNLFLSTVNKDIDKFIAGENKLLFAYGTTSSGKTFTIFGNNQEPGILPRLSIKVFVSLANLINETNLCPDQGSDVRTLSPQELEIFEAHKDVITALVDESSTKSTGVVEGFSFDMQAIDSMVDRLLEVDGADPEYIDPEATYSVWVSYLEVYNENIYDLLNIFKERKPLKLGLDSKKDTYVKGLHHVQVSSWIEMWKVFLYGRCRLHTNETQLNKASSRSHSVFTMKLIKSKHGICTLSCLSVCDLAGAERQKKALNKGCSLVESKNINTSLMILNRCFTVIRENKITNQSVKPPFRESKLTQIFQKAFSYGEQMTMFVNISLNPNLVEETKNVLKMSAVAQEMVKQLPKNEYRFLKPNSRFSIMCSNPFQAISDNQPVEAYSGVMLLSDSTATTSIQEESKQMYEDKIRKLEDQLAKLTGENKQKDDKIKEFLEMLEDARDEYLNLEEQLSKAENKLAEVEMHNEDLENELEDQVMMYDVKVSLVKQLEEHLSETRETVRLWQNKFEEMAAKNQDLEEQLEKRNEAPPKKGRPLLKALVHLNESNDMSSDSTIMFPTANSTVQETLTPLEVKTSRSTRKCKKQ